MPGLNGLPSGAAARMSTKVDDKTNGRSPLVLNTEGILLYLGLDKSKVSPRARIPTSSTCSSNVELSLAGDSPSSSILLVTPRSQKSDLQSPTASPSATSGRTSQGRRGGPQSPTSSPSTALHNVRSPGSRGMGSMSQWSNSALNKRRMTISGSASIAATKLEMQKPIPMEKKPVEEVEESLVKRMKRALTAPSLSACKPLSSEAIVGSKKEDLETMDEDDMTTILLKNIPYHYTRQMVLQWLNSEGFEGSFDFVYYPMDFGHKAGMGYAFLNMLSNKEAKRVKSRLQDFNNWDLGSDGERVWDKSCDVPWSGTMQGQAAYVERFRNSPVMHPDVSDEYKPMIFRHGCRLSFPAPTKRIKAPRVRSFHAPSTL